MRRLKEYLSTPEGNEQKWTDINGIMDTFDFRKVAAAMRALGWRWACAGEDKATSLEERGRDVIWTGQMDWYEYVPEEGDLRESARDLLTRTLDYAMAYQEESPEDGGTLRYESSTGGFTVTVRVFDDETRTALFGGDAPDDFAHAVDIVLRFTVEESFSKTM